MARIHDDEYGDFDDDGIEEMEGLRSVSEFALRFDSRGHYSTTEHSKIEAVCATLGIQVAHLRELRSSGLLSFDPSPSQTLKIHEWREVMLLGGMLAAGLPVQAIHRVVADLNSPYCYYFENIAYNFVTRKWVTILPVSTGDLVDATIVRCRKKPKYMAKLARRALSSLSRRFGLEEDDDDEP